MIELAALYLALQLDAIGRRDSVRFDGLDANQLFARRLGGGLVATRTPDLYRVKVEIINKLQPGLLKTKWLPHLQTGSNWQTEGENRKKLAYRGEE